GRAHSPASAWRSSRLEQSADRNSTVKMNLWNAKWDLDEGQCPCDVHWNGWIEDERLTGKTIYHFGTGKHHVVGIAQAQNGSGNTVFGITASPEEYDAYLRLVTDEPRIAKSYLCY